ncbi:biotin--[acetyl-CoA-carboxylase] ligase [Candidatus Dependentiae bacterium]
MIIGSKFYHKIKCYNSIDWAKTEINNAPDGSIFISDKYELTRGRQGRLWKRYPGQLIMTVLLKPESFKNIDTQNLNSCLNKLSMAISLGILKPLLAYGVMLKWPNDFVFKNKKIGGVLGSAVWLENKVQGIIFGFALNVNNVFKKNDELFKVATSLRVLFKDKIDENLLFKDLINSIDLFYQRWIDEKYSYIYKFWKHSQYYLGKNIVIHNKDGNVIKGLFFDVLENGDLILKIDNKECIIINFCLIDSFSFE